jgi:hypothetical protein
MFGLKRKAKELRESFVAGATNIGNVTATVGNKLVLNWHGTPTQRDGVLGACLRCLGFRPPPRCWRGGCSTAQPPDGSGLDMDILDTP